LGSSAQSTFNIMTTDSYQNPNAGKVRLASFFASLVMVAVLALCSGCLASKSYIDAKFRDATYLSIKVPDKPAKVVVNVAFQTNGKPNKRVDGILRRAVLRVFSASRLFTESSSPSTAPLGRFDITVNNVADVGAAFGKGFATGLTFGAAGSHVVDGYEMTATYTPPGASPITKTYRHGLHTTIGLHSTPEGLIPVPAGNGFDVVLEDMLLNFLRDLQKEGSL
jgi:hypothetical protein